jgi:hypothetical protein
MTFVTISKQKEGIADGNPGYTGNTGFEREAGLKKIPIFK